MQVISSNRSVPNAVRPASRCSRNPQSKTAQRTSNISGYGFLNYRFAPVTEDRQKLIKKRKWIEPDFFTSVKNICTLYQLEVPAKDENPYPLNVTTAYEQIKHHLAAIVPQLELIIVQEDNDAISLTTLQTLNTGNTLYYIPVRPLIDLLEKTERKKEAELLLFVFAYLYHVADIPWFVNCGTFMEDTYDYLEAWWSDTPEPGEEEEPLEKLSELQQLRQQATLLEKRLHKKKKLRGWLSSLRQFIPKDNFGTACKEVALSAYKLYKTYSYRSILHSVIPDLLFPEQAERMRIDHYLSFFWDSKGEVYDSLIDCINVSLQEYYAVDEPCSVQLFSQPQATIHHSLDFEKDLLKLIDELCTLLNKVG